jgi:hypothetical protein
MNDILAVRRFAAGDAPAAIVIVRGLPDYFTADGPARVERDVASHQARVITTARAAAAGRPAGPRDPDGASGRAPGVKSPGQKRAEVFRRLVTWVWA